MRNSGCFALLVTLAASTQVMSPADASPREEPTLAARAMARVAYVWLAFTDAHFAAVDQVAKWQRGVDWKTLTKGALRGKFPRKVLRRRAMARTDTVEHMKGSYLDKRPVRKPAWHGRLAFRALQRAGWVGQQVVTHTGQLSAEFRFKRFPARDWGRTAKPGRRARR